MCAHREADRQHNTTGKKKNRVLDRPWDLFHQMYSQYFEYGTYPKGIDPGTLNLNTFNGTDPKVGSVKPKVPNTIFFSLCTTDRLGLEI